MPDPGEPEYYVAESAARLVSDVPDSTFPDWSHAIAVYPMRP